MSTLEAIKQLADGPFHRLADDVLRRLEPRYRHLRTHGVNERGESIKGQPDSYVGDTAGSCSVAFCYTVERRRWWAKVVKDVTEACAKCPSATEIVVAIPHNADRDGPPKGKPDWHTQAKAAAGGATFRVVDGREIAKQLDQEHQDLRFEHLGIPFSRVTSTSIFASARKASAAALAAAAESGRFDAPRYLRRAADHELYRLWQNCLRDPRSGTTQVAPARLIPLVNDSGVGKTSLVCEFARSLGAVLPVLLIQARNLAFDTEAALVAHVVHAIQGVLEPSVRIGEEAAIVRHLTVSSPLTVIVDGLDETHAPDEVRRAITFWLRSRLGEKSVLIVTSRPEFWRTCSDQHWLRWTVQQEPSRTDDTQTKAVSGLRLASEIRLPDRFTHDELEAAWVKAGNHRANLFSLSADAQQELRHPFSLRVYLELSAGGTSPPPLISHVDLMGEWLNRRLDAESDVQRRITRELLQQALRIVATKLAASKGGAISVDALGDVPRFDPANPPGPVLQRLIEADILETVPNREDVVRFKLEAVQDFFHADADVDRIKLSPVEVAKSFGSQRFTDTHARLMRLGRRLEGEEVRHQFVKHLADENAAMAAVAISAAPQAYLPDTRANVAELLATRIPSRHRAPAAFAISLLREMNCPESGEVLTRYLFPPANSHRYLKQLGATALIALSYVYAADFVFRWARLGIYQGNDTYYDREDLARVRRAKPEFRHALGDAAMGNLAPASGEPMHARAVYVLALLGDERLVPHLETRLKENGGLENYENHALVALGSAPAADLFAKSFIATGTKVAEIGNTAETNDQWYRAGEPLHFYHGDLRYLLTPAFESQLARLVHSDVQDISALAAETIRRGESAASLYDVIEAGARYDWMQWGDRNERDVVSAELWLSWWRRSNDTAVRRRLLQVTPRYPSIDLEETLIAALDVSEFRGRAAHLLGEYGSVRALPRLRQLLSEDMTSTERSLLFDKAEAAHAVGDLRDEKSVGLLAEIAVAHAKSFLVNRYIENIGVIGTKEAEAALLKLLDDGVDERTVVSALIACGTESAMSVVVGRATEKADGVQWICERLRHLMFSRGWKRGRYYTHVNARQLVEFLDARFRPRSPKDGWDVLMALNQIDSDDVRWLLRRWASRRGASDDPIIREGDQRRLSSMCMDELVERGDEFALSFAVSDGIDEKEDHHYVFRAVDRLNHFPAESVAGELRGRFAGVGEQVHIVRYLSLLGRFGTPSDGEIARRYVDAEDDLLANVACETLLRLTDPLLVPHVWREV